MATMMYKVVDFDGEEVMRGSSRMIRDKFGLALKHGMTHYTKYGHKLKGKYFVYEIGMTEPNTEYERLLLKQCDLLKHYDSVVGFHKNIAKNIRDLADRGFIVEKRQAVFLTGRRKTKYWILEKV